MKKIVVFISDKGTGSNLQALIDACRTKTINGQITGLVSDKKNALGLSKAKKYNIKTLVFPLENKSGRNLWGKLLAEKVQRFFNPDIIVLAGFMLILPESFLKQFPIVVNLHPGLLPDRGKKIKIKGVEIPSFGGKMAGQAIEAAFALKLPATGSTVHLVTAKVDEGQVLSRTVRYIKKTDTPEDFYQKLKIKEHQILIKAVGKLCRK